LLNIVEFYIAQINLQIGLNFPTKLFLASFNVAGEYGHSETDAAAAANNSLRIALTPCHYDVGVAQCRSRAGNATQTCGNVIPECPIVKVARRRI
jgi:hypothetical protein